MSRLKASPQFAQPASRLPGSIRGHAAKGRRWWLITRLCPGCGYAGDELQPSGDQAVYMCPCCATDLYARPARSYAEMEGILELPVCAHGRRRSTARVITRIPRGRRVWRWVSAALARLR